MSGWDEVLAFSLFAAAAIAVAWRAYRAIMAEHTRGCGSACRSCPETQPDNRGSKLLLIEPGAGSKDAKP
jgi:hypothetical protein